MNKGKEKKTLEERSNDRTPGEWGVLWTGLNEAYDIAQRRTGMVICEKIGDAPDIFDGDGNRVCPYTVGPRKAAYHLCKYGGEIKPVAGGDLVRFYRICKYKKEGEQ